MENAAHPPGTVVAGGEPKLSIRILKNCNFQCPGCGTFSGPDRWGKLSVENIREIGAVLAEEKYSGVINISGGEPTLHPELNSIVSCLGTELPAAKIIVFTNGSWIGENGWENRCCELLFRENVLLRYSYDSEHIAGESRSSGRSFSEVKSLSTGRALSFVDFCQKNGMVPGEQYDFVFKGTRDEAKDYLSELGEVPFYTITFQKDPRNRPRTPGFFAVDIDENGVPAVYLTLGHLGDGDKLGGLDTLCEALVYNRQQLNYQRNHEDSTIRS